MACAVKAKGRQDNEQLATRLRALETRAARVRCSAAPRRVGCWPADVRQAALALLADGLPPRKVANAVGVTIQALHVWKRGVPAEPVSSVRELRVVPAEQPQGAGMAPAGTVVVRIPGGMEVALPATGIEADWLVAFCRGMRA